MKENIYKTNGLIVAESVMMALAPKMGRQIAHDLVYDCCRESIKNNISFIDTLLKNKEISNFFNEQDLLKIIDPSNYLGAAPTMAQRLLDNRKLPNIMQQLMTKESLDKFLNKEFPQVSKNFKILM